jgi:exonuclease I
MHDMLHDAQNWKRDKTIKSIFFNGRHYNFLFILTMQYSLGIQPELRSNFDFIFLLGEDMYSNRKRLFEHYAGMFPTRDIFDQVFLQVTQNYGCMVINNRVRSTDIRKKVFWYRAKKTPEFMIGCPKFIKWNEKRFDEEYDKKEQVLDLNAFCTRRKTNITVKLV